MGIRIFWPNSVASRNSQLTYESFQVRAGRYVRDNPEMGAIVWVDTDGKVEWVAPNEATATFVGDQLAGSA
jgi:hypothetical protein